MRAARKRSNFHAVKYLLILALAAGTLSFSIIASQPLQGPDKLPERTAMNVASLPVGHIPTAVAVEGWAKDREGRPVPGATVSLSSIQVTTDAAGYFSISPQQLGDRGLSGGGSAPLIDVAIAADGYAPWTITRVRYYSGDTVRLYPRLSPAGSAAVHSTAAQAHVGQGNITASYAPAFTSRTNAVPANAAGPTIASQLSVLAAGQNPPAEIRVYRTGPGAVEIVPFKEYVKHVLPNEWIPTWPQASLRAGAMAVKEYAWYWVAQGGKQTNLGADVKDNTDDQVYDPDVSYASTDTAVDATWQYAMTRSGSLFQASYCAGSYQADPSVDCPWDSSYMTQWGSKYYADQGNSWGWILQFYYTNVVITPTPPGGNNNPPPAPRQPAGQLYSVGQGATQPSIFQEAYDRNGGEAVLGKPAGPVRWWLPYVSENNVLAQPFEGKSRSGTMWLVFDTLKSNISGINRAYLLSDGIAAAYASHAPQGPEWVGAPTSDPYVSPASAGGLASQGFTRGTLSFDGQHVQFTPWPQQFTGWEADYFVGKPPDVAQAGPTYELPGQPANVLDVPSPDIGWSAASGVPQTMGVGRNDWSVQFTRIVQTDAGSYDFTVSADSGSRLWIDGLLAVNSWDNAAPHSDSYNADLDAGPHKIRIQYFSPNSAAQLSYTTSERGKGQASAPAKGSMAGQAQPGTASLRVKVSWLGRGPAPADLWVQPLTLQLSAPGNPRVVGSYQGTTDRNGVAIYSNLPSGIYDVHVKGVHSLQSARAAIVLPADATTDVDMKALIEGDVDGDNCVTINDFAVVQAMVGANSRTPGFNPAADLNGDGQVTVADVSLLRSGMDRCGDISADTQLHAFSSDNSPDTAQALAPWLSPDALHKDLSLGLVSSSSNARTGDIVQVAVVANTGSQAIDGSSFILHYDPAVLAPVDSSGNAATSSEPGLGLPSVLTNWVDVKGGSIGYAAGMLQDTAPSGQVVVTMLRFRALKAGSTALQFAPLASGTMQLTNGGVNLLSTATGLTLQVNP